MGIDGAYVEPLENAIVFLVVFLVLWVIGRYVGIGLLDRVLRKRGLDEHVIRPIQLIAKVTVAFIAIAIAFGLAGFGNFLVAMAGIAAALALAIGFATQSLIANVVSGMFIYVDKPFQHGDWIEWDDHSGTVEDISLRVTRVRTFDNELLTVPNGALANGIIKNVVDADRLRVRFDFGIGYDDDIETASEIIVAEAEAHPEILERPMPSVRLIEFGDSDVVLQSRFWIGEPTRADYQRIRGEYLKSVKGRFDDADIDIPYPIRTLSGRIGVENE